MVTFIALDASSEACSVTLVRDQSRWTLSCETPKSHAQQLLPFVHQLMQQHAVSIRQLSFIACCQGPGSFTGLRIGVGVAQGLAFGAGIPLVEVCSLAAMARSVGKESTEVKHVISLLDARMGEIYWALYDISHEIPAELIPPTLSAVTTLPGEIRQIFSASSGSQFVVAGKARRLLTLSDEDFSQVVIRDEIAPSSESVADIGQHLWSCGVKVPPGQFELQYLRNSVSWNKRQRIRR